MISKTKREIKGLQILATLQQNKIRGKVRSHFRVVPSQYRTYNAAELFRRSLAIYPEFKGKCAMAYAEYGFGIGVTLSAGIDLLPEGDPIDQAPASNPAVKETKTVATSLGLSITGSVKFAYLTEILLVIHRPFARLKSRRNEVSAGVGPVASAARTPVNFMTLTGAKTTFAASLSADFSMGIGYMPFGEKNPNLVITLASAGVSVEANCLFYYLKDPYPGWYENGTGKKITNDYRDILQIGLKKTQKREVVDWLRGFVLKEYVLKIKKKFESPELIALERTLSKLPAPSAFTRLKNLQNPFSNPSEDLAKELDLIFEQIKVVATVVPSKYFSRESKQKLLKNVQWYADSIRAAKEAEDNVKKTKSLPQKRGADPTLAERYQQLSFVDVMVMGPFGGQANASVGPAITATVPWQSPDAKTKGGVNVVSGGAVMQSAIEYQRMNAYTRMQAFAMQSRTRVPIVFTQDAKLVYHKTKAGLSAVTQFNIQAVGDVINRLQGSKEKKAGVVINKLTYSAVSAYWQLPADPAAGIVTLLDGSGISFGVSFDTAELEYTAALAAKNKLKLEEKYDYDRKVFSLAERLRIDNKLIKKFLALLNQNIQKDKKRWAAVGKKYEQLLIESAHRFTNLPNVPLNTAGNSLADLRSQPVFKNALDETAGSSAFRNLIPETIRIRYRVADSLEDNSSFTLKTYTLPVSLAVEFSKLQKAGNEGIEDLFVCAIDVEKFFNFNYDVSYLDWAVPGVNILPHTFPAT